MKSNIISLFNDDSPDPDSLYCEYGLSQVESMMELLARGEHSDQAGKMVLEHLSTGGKRIRARLSLAAASALGLARQEVIPWAASVELLHNATLIHDDIQDGDTIRRGKPTTWVVHGEGQAINAGDLLLMLPFISLTNLSASDSVRFQLMRRLAEQSASIVRGQVAEMALLENRDLSHQAYLRSVQGKTSGLFSLPVEGAALLSGHSTENSRILGECFSTLGTLFQLQDDILDLYGNKGRDRRGMDICEGKVSALVVRYSELVPDDRESLLAVLKKNRTDTTSEDIFDLTEKFKHSGALEEVLKDVRGLNVEVLSNQYLLRHPSLYAIAEELSALILKPIKHLL